MDTLLTDVFYEVAALLAFASVIGMLGLALRQPLIVSFIAVGILAGPAALDIVRSAEPIELLAELGIALLLFLVGLKLDLSLIRTIGGVSLTTGLGQVVFTAVIGFAIGIGFGLPPLASLYVAAALSFSSTIIVVKLLSDKREIDSLHGRIALGVLIVQDLMVVLAMAALSAFGVGAASDAPFVDVLLVLGNGVLLLAATGVFIRYAAEPLLKRIARAPELLVLFAIGWAAFVAALADFLGFSKELGGLLAGVSLASTPYREAIASRLTSLRDFLLLFFFIELGAQLDLTRIGDQVLPALLLSAFVLIGKPLIIVAVMGAMGYRKRTGFLAGLTLAQISEFSLIFMAMGLALGHVDAEATGLVTLVGLVTIGLSTYMILYSRPLYDLLERFLSPFERAVPYREQEASAQVDDETSGVILFGLGRYGSAIHQGLSRHGFKVLGVDFDPEAVRAWQARGLPAVYGDMLDPDFPSALPLERASWVISAVPAVTTGVTHEDPRATLVQTLRAQGYRGRIAVAAAHEDDARALKEKGADLVFMPFVDAADQAVDLVLKGESRTRSRVREPVPGGVH